MATVQEIRKRDQHTKIAHFMGASPEECDLIKTQQERRYLLTVVDQLAVALREQQGDIESYFAGEPLPKSCGACGTPNASCDNDCAAAGWAYIRWMNARKALALVDPTPEPTKGEHDGE
jgi:hypothetical protein